MSDSARFLGSGRKEEEKKKKKRNQKLRNGIFAYQPDLDGRGDDAGERAVPREGGRRWLLLFGVEVEEVEVEVEVKGVEGEEEKVQSSTPINFSSSSSELSFFLSLPPRSHLECSTISLLPFAQTRLSQTYLAAVERRREERGGRRGGGGGARDENATLLCIVVG